MASMEDELDGCYSESVRLEAKMEKLRRFMDQQREALQESKEEMKQLEHEHRIVIFRKKVHS